MGLEVAISLLIIAITIVIHASGSILWFRYQFRHFKPTALKWKLRKVMRVLIANALFLVILHSIEITIWSLVYLVLPGIEEIKTFEEAIYFSIVTYTSLGYGDITLNPTWRIIAGFEAINGIILIGWTTAMFYTVIKNAGEKYRDDQNQDFN